MENQYDFAVYKFVVDMVSEMTVEQELKIQVETAEMVVGNVVRNAQNIGALVDMTVAVVVAVVVVVAAAADVIVEVDKEIEIGKKLSNS